MIFSDEKTRPMSKSVSESSIVSSATSHQNPDSHIGSQTGKQDLPPDYEPPQAGPSNQPPNDVTTSNYVSIDRPRSAIRGTYKIDPSMSIPDALLSPWLDEQTSRPNLSLRAHHNAVDVDIHLVEPQNTLNIPKRIILDISSTHGSVTVRLHNTVSVPITLNAASRHGQVSVHLPRSFHGIVNQTVKHGKIRTSDEVDRVARVFSEVRGERVTFIGDTQGTGWDEAGKEWLGSRVSLETTHHGVKLFFVDELDDSGARKRGPFGLFGGKR